MLGLILKQILELGTWKKPSFTITEESMSLNILVTFILQKTKKQKSPKETKIQKR